jgi:DNA-binding transcriptional ArsR family regulator
MPATVHRFRSKRSQLETARGQQIRQLLLDLGDRWDLPGEAVTKIVAAVDGQTASERGWAFVMMGPKENEAVVAWLRENSKRPMAAMAVWAALFTALRFDTGEIALSRDELAERVSISPRNVSSIMTELVETGAVSRVREGRRVRYFMNPNIGTHLTGKERDKAQSEARQLSLRLVGGSQSRPS